MDIYTEDDYAKSYTELIEILKHISPKRRSKIPKEVLEMYNLKRDEKYDYKYNNNLKLEEQNMSHLTKILIANIYINYWTNEEERKIIESNDKKELYQNELDKREKYNPDNLFKTREKNKPKEVTDIAIIKKKNIFEKIIEKIKSAFDIK